GVITSEQNVNLREGPGMQYMTVRVLPPGMRMVVLEQQDEWYRVRLSDGTEGWVSSPLLDVLGTPTPTLEPSLVALIQSPVTRNEQWRPVIREFGGMDMVLVPAGCYLMGSTYGDVDE